MDAIRRRARQAIRRYRRRGRPDPLPSRGGRSSAWSARTEPARPRRCGSWLRSSTPPPRRLDPGPRPSGGRGGGPPPDRVHEPAVRPLRRPHRLENLHFPRRPAGVPRRDRSARIDGLFAFSGWALPARLAGNLSGDEAEAGALVRLVHSRGPPAGRAHQRRGPRLPPRLLADLHVSSGRA